MGYICPPLRLLVLSATICLLLLHHDNGGTHALVQTQPNIVFSLVDDLGYADVGYHNQSDIKTPNIDSLASAGVKLENYYVQPICSPTRSCLMSGRYQIHTGLVHGIIQPCQPHGLPLDSPTLADKLKESGYATHMVGKWHLGYYQERYCPWNRGFDTFFGLLLGSEDHYTHKRRYRRHPYLDLHDEKGPISTENGHYSTNMFTEKAVDTINAHDPHNGSPLFLYLAYQAVHAPLQVPQKYEDMYPHIQDSDRRTFAGMMSAVDEGIGNLTTALKQKGLWDNTILVFSTDNGGKYSKGGNNFPLRGQKGSLWEGGVHGVGFVSGGKTLDQRGKINTELIHVSDWYPTLVGLAQGSLNGTKPLDGVDQWDTINQGVPSKRKMLLHNIDVLYRKSGSALYDDTFDTSVRAAIRVGDFKLITGNSGNGTWGSSPGQPLAFETPSEKPNKNLWLFNIKQDPEERNDLSAQQPDIVRDLLGHLQKYYDTAVTPSSPQNDRNCNPALHGGIWMPWSADVPIVG